MRKRTKKGGSRRNLYILLVFLAGVFLVWLKVQTEMRERDFSDMEKKTIKVSGEDLFVYVAKSDFEKQRGLSGVEKLSDKKGMLFEFDRYSRTGFWMKGMKMSIDILWIKDNKVVQITKKIPVYEGDEELMPIYYPDESVNRVLEVASGFADRKKVEVGDEVKINNNK